MPCRGTGNSGWVEEKEMASVNKQAASSWRAVIGSAFYANSVRRTTMAELYNLSLQQPEVMSTTEPMYEPEWFGLPKDAKVLVSNDGGVVGRTARARKLVRQLGKADRDKLKTVLLEAVFQFNRRQGLWLEGIVGLHKHFMVKAHLLSPVTDAKNMLDWGLNFTPFMKPWDQIYNESGDLNESDILVLADPEWSNPEYPSGLVIIDETENCIAILGMRYFGERKKGTLTLAWTIGVRHNMVACHGGIKTIGDNPPVAVFGLSGSGKSSITNSHDHAGTLKPDEKVTVIHDDAFLIDFKNNITVALEPALFDKTDSMKFDDPDIKYYPFGPERCRRRHIGRRAEALGRRHSQRQRPVHKEPRYVQLRRLLRGAQKGDMAPKRPLASAHMPSELCGVVCLDGGVSFHYEGQGGGERRSQGA